jgi:hypothetical protein
MPDPQSPNTRAAPRRWTAAEQAQVDTLLAARPRPTIAHVAAAIGRTEGQVKGFLARRNDGDPAPAERAARRRRRSRRACLMCGAGFMSAGPGNRVCGGCKQCAAWRSGADLSLDVRSR